jgi:hypothetical protein
MVTTKSAWAKRATDPQLDPQPEYASVPDPPVYLHTNASVDLCNTYLPSSNSVGLERLLWMVQYLVASGFYVVVSRSCPAVAKDQPSGVAGTSASSCR